MSLTPEELTEQRRQKIKAKNARYNEANREVRRLTSLAKSKARTLETTARRIKSHTVDELIEIIAICYQHNPSDFIVDKDAIERIVRNLHKSQNVISPGLPNDICDRQQTHSSSSDQDTNPDD